MLDGILDVTKESLNESNSQPYSRCNADVNQVAEPTNGEQEVTLLKKIDLVTGLVQDMVPVVKKLQEAHDASLLQDGKDVLLSQSVSDEGEEPTRKRSRSEPVPNKQPRSKKAGELVTDATGKVDFLVTEVTEDEVMGLAITQPFLTTYSAVALMSKPLSCEKKTSMELQTANYLFKRKFENYKKI